jgi:hypothetical protein
MTPGPETSDGTGADMVFPFSSILPSRSKSAAPRLVPAKYVVSTMHGTRTVLLDARSGHYWGLDEVGSRIWMLAVQGFSPPRIVERLAAEYEAPVDELSSDVEAFLSKMRASKLLEEAP